MVEFGFVWFYGISFLLRVWGFHNSCTASNHHFPPQIAYFHYFDCKIGDRDKSWAPHIYCKPCYNGLTAWFNGKKAAFNFAVPMVWREPRNHADDCYFCLTNITGFNASSRKKIKYPNLRSAMRPVPHSDDLPVPTPPLNKDFLSSSDEEMPSREDTKFIFIHINSSISNNLFLHKYSFLFTHS